MFHRVAIAFVTLNLGINRCSPLLTTIRTMSGASPSNEFWETAFINRKEMWGFNPSPSTVLANEFFLLNNVKDILVPGIGYGRNAQIFKENGMQVTGIEISKTAIEMAHKHYGGSTAIYHGSVTDMPFDDKQYDAVYCYALIHLLDEDERRKLIKDCYSQLKENGYMLFVAITKDAPTYGKGTLIAKDRFLMDESGVKLFFYDRDSVEVEFGSYGLFEVTEVIENLPFYLIKCRK